MEHKVQYIEQFANDTVEKYQELANQQQNRHQIDELKEKNKQLKNVSLKWPTIFVERKHFFFLIWNEISFYFYFLHFLIRRK